MGCIRILLKHISCQCTNLCQESFFFHLNLPFRIISAKVHGNFLCLTDDKTRVILLSDNANDDADDGPAPSSPGNNDYINASHVLMEIPGSNITNRYIACQGPLIATCPHYWMMVWQQQCRLIVMLTTCVEQGRCDYGVMLTTCIE